MNFLCWAVLFVLFAITVCRCLVKTEGYDELSLPSEVVLNVEKPLSIYKPTPYFSTSPPYDPNEIDSVQNSWGTSLSGLYSPEHNFYLPWTNPEGRKPSTFEELQLTDRLLQHGEYSTGHDGLYPY